MSLLSPRITAFFIIALVFPFHSGNAFIKSSKSSSECARYDKPTQGCPRNYQPVCATDGQTYSNKCVFCVARKKSGDKIDLANYGKC